MARTFKIALGIIALSAMGLNPGVALADPEDFIIERVVRTGDPVPGIDGAIWSYVSAAGIDGQGNVLLYGAYPIAEGDYFAYFYGPPGDLKPFMEENAPAPGFDDPEVLLVDLNEASLAENGRVASFYEVGDPDDASSSWTPCLYTGIPGPLDLTLYEEGPAPDSPQGAYVTSFDNNFVPYVNASGQVGVWGWVVVPEGEDTTRKSIIAGPPNALRVIAQAYGPVPDIEGGATFMDGEVPSVGGFAFNDLGWAGFSAWFEGPLVDETNGLGLFAGTADDLRLVARIGTEAPGMDEGVYFTNFLWEEILLDANRNAAFVGFVDGPGIDDTNDIGVWYGPRDDLQFVSALRGGSPAPGTALGTTFTFFLDACPNNRSELLSFGYVGGDDVDDTNDQGFWYGPRQDIQLILRDGQQAPELPADVLITFDNGDYAGTLYRPYVVMNDRGDMLMVCPLTGAVNSSNDRALYYRGADDGAWHLVVRTGNELDGLTVAPEGLWIFTFEPGNAASGHPRNLNDDGSFVVTIGFDKDIYGIYRIGRLPQKNAPGDWDNDGDIDLVDYAGFQLCFGANLPECDEKFDFDGDGAVTLEDYEALLSRRTSPHYCD